MISGDIFYNERLVSYFFCTVPNLALKVVPTSSTAAHSAVYIDSSESLDVIEIKQDQLITDRTADFPHEYT